jgi:hypothetical protein
LQLNLVLSYLPIAKQFEIYATRLQYLTINNILKVVQDAHAFQAICDRAEQAEAELRALKLATLQQDINLGIAQLKNGDYSEYDADTLPNLLENIKNRGQKRLAHKNESI